MAGRKFVRCDCCPPERGEIVAEERDGKLIIRVSRHSRTHVASVVLDKPQTVHRE